MGNIGLCLNDRDNQCWIRQGNKEYFPSILSNEAVYLLKWKSMYYNYLPYDFLKSDKGIQQYGVPSDYYKEEEKKKTAEEEEEIIKMKEVSKILVKER